MGWSSVVAMPPPFELGGCQGLGPWQAINRSVSDKYQLGIGPCPALASSRLQDPYAL